MIVVKRLSGLMGLIEPLLVVLVPELSVCIYVRWFLEALSNFSAIDGACFDDLTL